MKTVIVTGAAGNLASAVLRTLLDSGYHVVATVLANSPVAVDAHAHLDVHAVDASKPEEVKKFVSEIASKHGTIDGLIHLVGGYAGGKLEDTTPEQLQSMHALNFETAYHYVQPVFAVMKKQGGGKMILVGSRPGKSAAAAKTSVAYGLSKSLVFRLAEIVNEEGKETNIRAVVVVPSTIDTPANRKSMPKADFSKWNRPEDIAKRMEEVLSGKDKSQIIEF